MTVHIRESSFTGTICALVKAFLWILNLSKGTYQCTTDDIMTNVDVHCRITCKMLHNCLKFHVMSSLASLVMAQFADFKPIQGQ